MDCSPPGSSVPETVLGSMLEWAAMLFSSGSSQLRDWTHISHVSCIAGGFFHHWATGKSPDTLIGTCQFIPSAKILWDPVFARLGTFSQKLSLFLYPLLFLKYSEEVEEKRKINRMREKKRNREIESYSWVSTPELWLAECTVLHSGEKREEMIQSYRDTDCP